MKIAITICVPSDQRKFANWGDIYYAMSLQKAINSLGHKSIVLFMDEWYLAGNKDMVIHIRGLHPFEIPKTVPHKVMWNINHPELINLDELYLFNHIYSCSKSFSEMLTQRTIECLYLPQAGDSDYFIAKNTKKEYDVLFVGNNHLAQNGTGRTVVKDYLSLNLEYNFKVVGAAWKGFLPDDMILSEFVEWKELPELYSKANIVLNDHQDTMKQNGYINNRTFDLALLKQCQICDNVPGLEDFGIITYKNRIELKNLIIQYMENPEERLRQEKIAYELCKNENFYERAKTILDNV